MTPAPRGTPRVTIVAAVARNGVIGVQGGLPWHLPGELQRVKQTTMGHVLVMGRVTYESIGRPLPGRTTVVVTRQPHWRVDSELVRVAPDVHTALQVAAEVDDEVFVFGGAQVYAAALAVTDRMLLTLVDQEPAGDTRFPEVDWTQWQQTARDEYDGWAAVTYERVHSL